MRGDITLPFIPFLPHPSLRLAMRPGSNPIDRTNLRLIADRELSLVSSPSSSFLPYSQNIDGLSILHWFLFALTFLNRRHCLIPFSLRSYRSSELNHSCSGCPCSTFRLRICSRCSSCSSTQIVTLESLLSLGDNLGVDEKLGIDRLKETTVIPLLSLLCL